MNYFTFHLISRCKDNVEYSSAMKTKPSVMPSKIEHNGWYKTVTD